MKVKITPNLTYNPGHINTVLALVAPGPTLTNKDGSVLAKLTDAQLDDFNRRGGSAHKVEVLAENTAQASATELELEPETQQEIEIEAGERTDISVYVDTCRHAGASDDQIITGLMTAGWSMDQATAVVKG